MPEQTPEQTPITALSEEECWTLLAAERVGRLAYRLVDEIHVVPVNYALREERLVVATGAGNKLLAAELGGEVGLEVDELTGPDPWSVLVRGALRHLDEDDAARFTGLAEESWVPDLRYDVIEVVPTTVTGRRAHRST